MEQPYGLIFHFVFDFVKDAGKQLAGWNTEYDFIGKDGFEIGNPFGAFIVRYL